MDRVRLVGHLFRMAQLLVPSDDLGEQQALDLRSTAFMIDSTPIKLHLSWMSRSDLFRVYWISPKIFADVAKLDEISALGLVLKRIKL